ncbi:hypothetical protein [uncultured Methanobrevibacter sp.]|uniref:hypothetical protein n=1 Tax=uncultured Methanobrevibacter sp. TaxID=253161 RepID=UPI0025DA8F88|nr:hypothetical protein [uncultured Methanobrevibacter sp.]
MLYAWSKSYGLFDDFNFVILTLTTAITAAISSFLTDRLLKDDDEELENLIEEKYESLFDELKTVKEENKKLHEDIKNWLKTNNPLIKKTVIQFNF